MRVKSVTERYRAVNEGTMTKKEFVRQMRQQYPMHITQFNGFDDSVQILKNRGLLFEAKKEEKAKVYDDRPALNYSLDALDRGIRAELGTNTKPSVQEFKAAEKKAKDNLEKNPTHYLDLMSGESNKVDKHDREVETKRGKEEVDVFNGLKKAALKEGYTEEQISDAIQKIKEKKAAPSVQQVEVMSEEDKKDLASKAITAIKAEFGEISGIAGMIREFLMTHFNDIMADPNMDYVEEFKNFVDANYDRLDEGEGQEMDQEIIEYIADTYIQNAKDGDPAYEDFIDLHISDAAQDVIEILNLPSHPLHSDTKEEYKTVEGYKERGLFEKKGQDHDGDGDVDGDDYMAAKDKAIKKAMGKGPKEGMYIDDEEWEAEMGRSKEDELKEAVKSIIRKVLTEESLNEAATGNLSAKADEYEGFQGLPNAINQLENIVTDIESYYTKVREKIQKVYDDLGNVTNEEGLKVGGFIAPAIEAAFMKDLKPVVAKGFTKGLETPKVRSISQADIDAHNSGERPLGEVEIEEKQTMFTPVYEVNFSKAEIIKDVSFPNGGSFKVGEYSNEYGMKVVSIQPVPEGEREEDEVVYVNMEDGDDGISVPFNAQGEEVEI